MIDYAPPHIYEYDESYNSIPEDQSNYNNAGYEGITQHDPYRLTYSPQDPGYFGPPIPPTNPVYVPNGKCYLFKIFSLYYKSILQLYDSLIFIEELLILYPK